MMNSPKLSVVIAAVNGAELLEKTLDAIDRLPERKQIEVLIVQTEEVDGRKLASTRHQPIKIVEGGCVAEGIPRLRHRGIQAAHGEMIAILEDHVEVDSAWAWTIFEVMSDQTVSAVGGRVDAGVEDWFNHGVFLADYARYIGPVAEGDHADLPGNNIAYRRKAIMSHADDLAEGRWESWVNARLAANGARLVSTNQMIVRHIKRFSPGELVRHRWHFGRSYAGMRLAELGTVKRLVYVAGSTILPALLTLRATRMIAGRNVGLGVLVKSWPVIAMVMTVGAAGECAGYLFGPGRSLEHVR